MHHVQAVPVASLPGGMGYQYLQPAGMSGQQMLANGMAQLQVRLMHNVFSGTPGCADLLTLQQCV